VKSRTQLGVTSRFAGDRLEAKMGAAATLPVRRSGKTRSSHRRVGKQIQRTKKLLHRQKTLEKCAASNTSSGEKPVRGGTEKYSTGGGVHT